MDLSGRPLLGTERDKELFVGRAELLEELNRAVGLGLNVLALGPRGIGKSSLLHVLESQLRSRGARTVFLDGRRLDTATDVLEAIRARLGLPLAESSPGPADRFDGLLRTLSAIRIHGDVEQVVVLLDGAGNAAVAHGLFGRHRDELWGLPLRWIAAADEAVSGLYTQPPADAFWEVTLTIPPLAPDEATEVLRRRTDGRFDAETMDEILSAGQGSPRQLVHLARFALQEQSFPSSLRAARVEQAARLGNLGRAAHMLFAELEARGPSSASDPQLQQALGWTRPRLTQVLRQLEAAGLVRAADVPIHGGGRPRRVYAPVPVGELR